MCLGEGGYRGGVVFFCFCFVCLFVCLFLEGRGCTCGVYLWGI